MPGIWSELTYAHMISGGIQRHMHQGPGPLLKSSKVILRHANLSTTQRYLGKVSDTEAIRWIENIHG